jgi:hypothetical protein
MDVRKSQTSTATPAKPGDFHCWFNHEVHEDHENKQDLALPMQFTAG